MNVTTISLPLMIIGWMSSFFYSKAKDITDKELFELIDERRTMNDVSNVLGGR